MGSQRGMIEGVAEGCREDRLLSCSLWREGVYFTLDLLQTGSSELTDHTSGRLLVPSQARRQVHTDDSITRGQKKIAVRLFNVSELLLDSNLHQVADCSSREISCLCFASDNLAWQENYNADPPEVGDADSPLPSAGQARSTTIRQKNFTQHALCSEECLSRKSRARSSRVLPV